MMEVRAICTIHVPAILGLTLNRPNVLEVVCSLEVSFAEQALVVPI
jgi:hypothetical protein